MKSKNNLPILIVDDEPNVLTLLEKEFQASGYNTKKATSGTMAIELLQNNKFHAVVCDFRMPNGNGMEVLKCVNQMELKDRPLFYFISGHADFPEKEASNAGAKKYYAKPFDLKRMIKEIIDDITSR